MGFNGADPSDRLDKDDAQFVDVIHTHGCTTLIQTYQVRKIIIIFILPAKKTLKFYKSFIKTAGTYIDEGSLF